MTAQNDLSDLLTRVRSLPALIRALEKQIVAVDTRMTALKHEGLIYASPHWRAGRYLQLIHPQKDGVRSSPTYIGADEKKISEALQGIERAKEYDELARIAQYLAGKVSGAGYALNELEKTLTIR